MRGCDLQLGLLLLLLYVVVAVTHRHANSHSHSGHGVHVDDVVAVVGARIERTLLQLMR